MIKVVENLYDGNYEIYFKIDDDGELLYWDKGTRDLHQTIRICDELNRNQIQTGGHFVVCSEKGIGYDDIVIEYEEERL